LFLFPFSHPRQKKNHGQKKKPVKNVPNVKNPTPHTNNVNKMRGGVPSLPQIGQRKAGSGQRFGFFVKQKKTGVW